jgi:hypothetical protein
MSYCAKSNSEPEVCCLEKHFFDVVCCSVTLGHVIGPWGTARRGILDTLTFGDRSPFFWVSYHAPGLTKGRTARHKYWNVSKYCIRETKSQATSSDTFLFTLRIALAPRSRAPPPCPSTMSSSKSPPRTSPRTPVYPTSPLAPQHRCPISSSAQSDLLSSALTQSTDSTQCRVECGCHTCNLLDGSLRSPTGAYNPEPKGVGKDDPEAMGV